MLGIDRSEAALTLAEASARLNGVGERCAFRRGDVFAEAASLAGSGERFDIVVADPPPFARSKRDVPAALRGYRKLARLAAQLTAPGGFLFVASCSHNVGAAEFADAVRRGLTDAGRSARILRESGAGPDHPVHPALPETGYLKALTLSARLARSKARRGRGVGQSSRRLIFQNSVRRFDFWLFKWSDNGRGRRTAHRRLRRRAACVRYQRAQILR